MKHYTKIIIETVDEDQSKCDTNTSISKTKETMSTISYSPSIQATLSTEISALKLKIFEQRIQNGIAKLQFRASQVFRIFFKVTFRIVRFAAFLIHIINNATIQL